MSGIFPANSLLPLSGFVYRYEVWFFQHLCFFLSIINWMLWLRTCDDWQTELLKHKPGLESDRLSATALVAFKAPAGLWVLCPRIQELETVNTAFPSPLKWNKRRGIWALVTFTYPQSGGDKSSHMWGEWAQPPLIDHWNGTFPNLHMPQIKCSFKGWSQGSQVDKFSSAPRLAAPSGADGNSFLT